VDINTQAGFIVHLLPPHFTNFPNGDQEPETLFPGYGLLCYLLVSGVFTMVDTVYQAYEGSMEMIFEGAILAVIW